MINWFSQVSESTVTISNVSITLNKEASKNFNDAVYVKLGYSEEKNMIYIKKVTKDEIDSYLDESLLNSLFHLTVAKTYARITSKPFIDYLVKELKILDFNGQKQLKFNCVYNTLEATLEVSIKGGQ